MKILYTDDQVVDATGLHIDNVRKLVTWGAVRPAKGGRGRGNVRQWDGRTARRIARVAAIVESGMSLRMAHTLTYLQVLDEDFDKIDPFWFHGLDKGRLDDGITFAEKYGWFDASKPLSPSEDTDRVLDIVNGRIISLDFSPIRDVHGAIVPIGFLTKDRSKFRTWLNFSEWSDHPSIPGRPKWQMRDGHEEIDPSSLAWEYAEAADVEAHEAGHYDQFLNPTSLLRINLSFACRVAMRKLLGIPVFFT